MKVELGIGVLVGLYYPHAVNISNKCSKYSRVHRPSRPFGEQRYRGRFKSLSWYAGQLLLLKALIPICIRVSIRLVIQDRTGSPIAGCWACVLRPKEGSW